MTLRTLTVRGIPEGVLKALRAAAKRNRRSLNAEVLVRLEATAEEPATRPASPGVGGEASPAGRAPGAVGRGARPGGLVREPEAQPYEVRRAFREADLSRLRSDLALTPEQRVHLAEEIARTAEAARALPRFQRVIQFDRYEDYLEWQRHQERGS